MLYSILIALLILWLLGLISGFGGSAVNLLLVVIFLVLLVNWSRGGRVE